MTGQPIEVYVELAGKEKYHQSLKGKDEPNQHPISAISNLEDNLLSINEKININKANIEELSVTTNDRFLSIQTSINDTKTDILNETTEKIEEVENYLKNELANIDLEGYYTKEETDEKLEGTFHYKGSVPDFESLPFIQNQKGDVYNVNKSGANYVWTGCAWDNLSPTICLKGYATKDYVDGTIEASVRLVQNHLQVHYYDKLEIDKKFNELSNIDPELLANTFVYRGSVLSISRLPVKGKTGDTYTIGSDNSKVFWNGANWEKLSEDLADKVFTKEEINILLADKADIENVYNKNEINDEVIRIEKLINDLDIDLTNLINDKSIEVSNNLQEKLDELSKQHDTDVLTLTRAIGDLGDHVKTAVERIDSDIQEVSTNLGLEIDNNTSLINNINVEIDNLKQKDSALIEKIKNNAQSIININNDIEGINNSITEINQDLYDINEEIIQIKEDPYTQWHSLEEIITD